MKTLFKIWLAIALNAVLFGAMYYFMQPTLIRPLHAASIPVTTTNDGGPGSLRAAIAGAALSPEADLITFDPSLNGQTITLITDTLVITSEVAIDASALPDSIRISGNHLMRVFIIDTGAVVTMTHLIIADGQTATGSGPCTDLCGGGIFLGTDSKLTLTDSVVTNNSANSGGGIMNEFGELNIDATEIISNYALYDGGGLRSAGNTTIRNSAIVSNTSDDVGGGGIFAQFAPLTQIISTTIAHNKANNAEGGGILASDFSTLSIESSTIAHNRAAEGSGIGFNVSIPGVSNLDIANSTLSSNQVTGPGAALYISATTSGSLAITLTHATIANHNGTGIKFGVDATGLLTPTIRNTMVAGSVGDNCVNVAGDAFNLSDDATCTGFTQGNALLGGLIDNGGPTLTHLPTTGSDAMGSANPAFCQAAPINGRDQRGVARANDSCDIGATEVEDTEFELAMNLAIAPPLQGVAVGKMAHFTITVENAGTVTLTNVAVNGAPLVGCNQASGALGDVGVGSSAVYTCSAEINNSLTYSATAQSQALIGGTTISDSASAQVLAASLAITKTVFVNGYREHLGSGVFNPSDCALASSITVPVNSVVKYCYTVTNTGDYTLTRHTLLDNQITGNVLNDLPQVLGPGATVSTVDVGVTPTQTLAITTTNVATWTATLAPLPTVPQPQPVVVTASATVMISGPTRDQDGDGTPDNTEGTGDLDGDGIPNYLDADDAHAPFTRAIFFPRLGTQ